MVEMPTPSNSGANYFGPRSGQGGAASPEKPPVKKVIVGLLPAVQSEGRSVSPISNNLNRFNGQSFYQDQKDEIDSLRFALEFLYPQDGINTDLQNESGQNINYNGCFSDCVRKMRTESGSMQLIREVVSQLRTQSSPRGTDIFISTLESAGLPRSINIEVARQIFTDYADALTKLKDKNEVASPELKKLTLKVWCVLFLSTRDLKSLNSSQAAVQSAEQKQLRGDHGKNFATKLQDLKPLFAINDLNQPNFEPLKQEFISLGLEDEKARLAKALIAVIDLYKDFLGRQELDERERLQVAVLARHKQSALAATTLTDEQRATLTGLASLPMPLRPTNTRSQSILGQVTRDNNSLPPTHPARAHPIQIIWGNLVDLLRFRRRPASPSGASS